MKILKNLQDQYEENPMKVKSWCVLMACCAAMTAVVAAGIKKDLPTK